MSEYSRQLGNVLQWLLGMALVTGLAALWPALGVRMSGRFWRWIARAARRPLIASSIAGVASVLVPLLIVAIAGPPLPDAHDEFSYLLAADTFAHGRLTNPTPDCWVSFETMHELMIPTYASKFGVAQGLSLALGQVVLGAPWVGLILVTALAVSALTWCLRAFLPPTWALFGGLVAAVHPQIVIWGHQYWGGNIGMLGGALILGSVARLLAPRRRHATSPALPVARLAATLALGLAILANSRPYETAVWGLIIFVALLVRIARQLPRHRLAMLFRVIAPAAAALIPVACGMAYYNWRVTGNALELPYTLHARQYMSVPLFFWQSQPPPRTYHNEQLRRQHEQFERGYFEQQLTPRGWLRWAGYKIYFFSELHLLRNLLISIGLIGLIVAIARRGWHIIHGATWLALIAAGVFVIAYAIIPWFENHYASHATPILFALALTGARQVRTWRLRGRPVGRALVRLAAVSCVLVLAFVIYRERRVNNSGYRVQRARLEDYLERDGARRHLVLVRYGPTHDPAVEWVFNRADIPASSVIWAHDLDRRSNEALIRQYGAGREIWRLDADAELPRLERYSGATSLPDRHTPR